ncbi:Cullin binding-domain-containing protein [Absidia repens]|uniref:Defective in cullin neddylation protein n=1 Tax=Absidia repens TaxID=90262 RepID=A0A1X2IJ12_9FUNG|nr:Cullin binding-domain-containing protein [Absidia repens]
MSLKRPLTYYYYNTDYQLMGTKQSTLSPSQQQLQKRTKRSTSHLGHGSTNTGFEQSVPHNTNRRSTTTTTKQHKKPQQQSYYTQEPKQMVQHAPQTSLMFNEQQCLQWFQYYADPDTPMSISPEGMQRFLEDLGISVEDKMAIVIAWKLNASTMGYITQDEWMNGMRQLSFTNGLFLFKSVDNNEGLAKRRGEFEASLEDLANFKSLYRYTFDYGKTKDQKCMDVEVACALWSILLGGAFGNMVQQFTQFLQETHPVRVINRDQWNSFYEFITTVSEDLSDHDEMAACKLLEENGENG